MALSPAHAERRDRMSKVLFFNIPAHGHTNPTLPLVKELTRRGERIVYYSSDNFSEKIRAAGAAFRSYGAGLSFDGHEIDKNIFMNAGLVMEASRDLMPGILKELAGLGELGDKKPDYIIHDSMCVWGKLVAQMLDVPAVCSVTMFAFGTRPALTSFSFLRALVKMWVNGFSGTARWFRAARWLNKRYRLNTYMLKDVFTNREPLNIVYTSRLFQPKSESFDERFRFVGPTVPQRRGGTLDFPLDEKDERPVLYVSLGTIVNEREDFYKRCFEAFGSDEMKREVRVVTSVGLATDVSGLGETPSNFVVRNRVPQLAVLERASAFITHAGMNSVSEAMLARVPLVLVPQTAEQAMVARRVAKLGAGVRLTNTQLTPANLRASVRELLSKPSYREAADRIATSFESAGGCERAADEILAFKKANGIR